ncbi:zinc metalloproteinase nas-13 [Orussus abietinus]|uniref:zinc metalloproteinase nas-13 n=1 Tax=Orussus abietinus TaxID=222816 RepID=UPI0006256B2E|nr:zinc metalloproteinase nas-13 [Orussus abietinus]
MEGLKFATWAWLVLGLVCALPAKPTRRDQGVETDDEEELIGRLSYIKGALYGEPKNSTGSKVDSWDEDSGMNPEELGEYAEGDILFQMQVGGRNGLRAESSRWPGGVIPYSISPQFSGEYRKRILDAMDDYRRYTCITFRPSTGQESNYIKIVAGQTGCWSSVGRVGGSQIVNLQIPGCVTRKGTIIHELMHAVGFLHEHSRYERDNYVQVKWENITPGRDNNFKSATRDSTNDFGVEYDYGSVMHYSAKAFSRNGQPTLVPRGNENVYLGQRDGFSRKDIMKINRMYKCNKQGINYG